MATYQTYQQIGIKEDISDVISNISPRKTPAQAAFGTEKIDNTLFQWQEDSLRAVATNSKVEGADASFITVAPTAMRNNRTQIMSEAVQVAGTADRVSTYGRAKEMAYQMAKSAAQVKRDLEHALVGTAQDKATGDANTARTFAGVQKQIDSGNIVYMGAATDITEAKLVEAIQAAYDAGADLTRIMVTPTNSLEVAGFASASGRYRTITEPGDKSTTLVNAVNLYVSPFGEQKVELNRFLKASNTFIYDPENWKVCWLRPWFRETLAKTGDSTKQMIIGEMSLKHKNFKASAMVIDNATTGF